MFLLKAVAVILGAGLLISASSENLGPDVLLAIIACLS